MEKLTITRALTELKTLKARLNKEITNMMSPVNVKYSGKLIELSHIKESDWVEKVKAEQQSIEDLQKRIFKIKTEIDKANETTKVKIGGKEMTIAEALVYKAVIIPFKEDILRKYKMSMASAKNGYEARLRDNDLKVERLTSDKDKDKSSPEEIKKSIDAIYPVEFLDPIKLDLKIKELEREIEDFNSEVDFVLSESNSTTFIEL